VVHVVHGAELGVGRGPGLVDHEHERAGVIALEVLAQTLFEDRRGKRPEPLPVLDPRVEDILHLRMAGVSDDRAVAQGPGAPFHAPLEPADDLGVGHGPGTAFQERAFSRRSPARPAARSADSISASPYSAPVKAWSITNDRGRPSTRCSTQ